MHLVITALVVLLSMASLVLIMAGAKKERIGSLSLWSSICLAAMLGGAIGTNVLPIAVFGIAERFSTFSAVVFNAVLGFYLLTGKFAAADCDGKQRIVTNEGNALATDKRAPSMRDETNA